MDSFATAMLIFPIMILYVTGINIFNARKDRSDGKQG